MRPIFLSEEDKTKLLEGFIKEFSKNLSNYCFESSQSITFTAKIGEKAKDKVRIIYTPEAYLKMKKLVADFTSEVGWFGLVDRVDDLTFRVYDVLVCKQIVSGAKVDTTDEDMLEFIENLTDEQSEHMHFQAHSHVHFDTVASGTDMQNQEDIIANMPGTDGFYIFQIWNKKDDINTYLYDLGNNVFYGKEDVSLEIEGVKDFIDDAKKKVETWTAKNVSKYYPSYGTPGKNYYPNYGGYYEDYFYGDYAKVPKKSLGIPDYQKKDFFEEDDVYEFSQKL